MLYILTPHLVPPTAALPLTDYSNLCYKLAVLTLNYSDYSVKDATEARLILTVDQFPRFVCQFDIYLFVNFGRQHLHHDTSTHVNCNLQDSENILEVFYEHHEMKRLTMVV